MYEDDFTDPLARYKEVTQQTTKSNPETMGRYHTNWLNMMYPRLRLAANLLRDDGVIFISIDDHEVFNLKKVCDEVFGEENFVICFPRVTKKAGKTTDDIAKNHDFILMYTKNSITTYNLQSHTDEGFKFSDEFVSERGMYKLNQTLDYDSLQYSPSLDYPIEINGEIFYPGNSYEKYMERKNGNYARADWAWRWSKELFDFGYKNGFIVIKRYNDYSRIYTKTYQNAKIVKKGDTFVIEKIQRTKALSSLEFIENEYSNDNSKKNLSTLFASNVFDYSKPVSLLKFLCKFTTSNDDIILDFFSGSATTAHAVMQLNAEDGGSRQFIMVQLPEVCDEKSEAYKAGYKNICEIGKERIRRAGKKINEELGIKSEELGVRSEELGIGNSLITPNSKLLIQPTSNSKLDIGFKVFKLDSSNLKTWDNTPVTAEQMDLLYERMNNMIHRVKSDRSDMDMVCEIMLKLGVPLTYSVTAIEINGKTAYSIGEDSLLLICLAPDVQPEDVEQMAEYAPAKLIISRESFVDDTAMANAHYILKDYGVELKLV